MSGLRGILLLAFAGSSCVTGSYTRWRELHEPEGIESLVAGEADLATCLEQLGAPILVRENGDGAVLAWGWRENQGWRVSASVPIDETSGSFTYGKGHFGLEGVVLFFDAGWQLVEVRRGSLREALPSSQQRAQLVE